MPSIDAARLTRASISAGGSFRALRPKPIFFAHRHVRVERIVLEHHGDVAVARPHVVDHLAADRDLAVADVLEAGDGPQQRALAAAGRADQHRELAVRDLEVDAAHGMDGAVALVQPPDLRRRPFRFRSLTAHGAERQPAHQVPLRRARRG